jgi:uncharacterized protein (DUF1778 family)
LAVKGLIFSDIDEYHQGMKNPRRTTLLINLSVDEAQQIRAAAKKQDRTISSYVLRAVMSRIRIEGQVENRERFFENYLESTRRALKR